MNYCIVRLGKGHLQPFVLWSLILKASTALTLQGHALRHEAFLDCSEHCTSPKPTSHMSHTGVPHSQQKQPHNPGLHEKPRHMGQR